MLKSTWIIRLYSAGVFFGVPDEDIETLDAAGEQLKIVYQLKDDELDLFGGQDKQERNEDLLRAGPDSDDIEDLIERFEDLDVRETVQATMGELHKQAATEIAGLGLPEQDRERLQALGRFCLERDR